MVPTVAIEGQFRFCRIGLNSGSFMEEPPPGEYRNILEAYVRYAEAIRKTWDDIHHR